MRRERDEEAEKERNDAFILMLKEIKMNESVNKLDRSGFVIQYQVK